MYPLFSLKVRFYIYLVENSQKATLSIYSKSRFSVKPSKFQIYFANDCRLNRFFIHFQRLIHVWQTMIVPGNIINTKVRFGIFHVSGYYLVLASIITLTVCIICNIWSYPDLVCNCWCMTLATNKCYEKCSFISPY